MHPIIQKLPFELALKKQIEEKGLVKIFPKGTIILEEGEYLRHLPLLMDGRIRVYKIEPNLDREILMYYVKKGETCLMSIFSTFQNHKSKVNGITTENSTILLIPIHLVQEWQQKYSTWNSYLMSGIEERYQNLLQAFEAVSFHKIDQRLEAFLLEYAQDKDTLTIPFSHQELANELGTTRVVISRILKTMESQNKLSLHRGAVKLKKN
ncbi:MAG: Crp/Fnr family transcriptional regulator [Aureispira sp.]|nr:Crp/Fnr family transcriptional regulator [Aureispira sp.]